MPPVNFADRSAVAVSTFFKKKYGIPSSNVVYCWMRMQQLEELNRIRTMVKE